MENRYSRQILFNPIGESGQEKISSKHVLIIGCGALGSANADHLVRAGIGRLTIVDRDYVEWSNLQRQQLYTEEDVINQLPKAIAAKKHLEAINSKVKIDALVLDATYESIKPFLKDVDIIIDATDNFDTRLMLNDIAQKYEVPWVFGSCVGSTGMSFTILPEDTPCLSCLLDSTPISGATCDSVGIIAPAVHMVVAHQTTEVLKLLVEDKGALRTKMVTFDLWNNFYQQINVDRAKKKNCPTCGEQPSFPYLQYENQTKSEILCGRNTVQIRATRPIDLTALSMKLKNVGQVRENGFLLSLELEPYRMIFFKDGRTLIHGTNDLDKAKTLYYQLVG